MQKTRVGVVGCGVISGIYLKMCHQHFRNIEVAACADIDLEKARARAAEFGVPKACGVDELLADRSIAIVLNLTVPKAHAAVALAALAAGKHVHGEKPLAVTRADAQKMVELARRNKLRLGAAPDTFLGAGLQTCRKLIDDGWIGRPVSATAFMQCHGHEGWHASPEFYYEVGGGPMLDMGPYYITALVSLLGPVARVCGSTQQAFTTRTITSQPKCGKVVPVETPTHLAGVMDFAGGAVGTLITSFDVWRHNLPNIEIHGTTGSLRVPDPNTFGGPVRLFRPGMADWMDVPLSHGYAENSRGIGVADLAAAIAANRPHRAGGDLACHVLDVMLAFEESSRAGRHQTLESRCERPAPMPMDLLPGTIDA